MRAIVRAAAAAALGLALGAPAAAQFTTAEASDSAAWETFLKSARIVDSVQLGGPDATSRPWKLTLERDGVRRFALWKDIDTEEFGAPDRWRYEIAAYRFDRLVGLGMVPPTVERRVGGRKGSLQLWADDTVSLKKKTQDGLALPEAARPAWNRAAYLERAFDSLIANCDRNANNILVTADWRMLMVDHSRSFRADEPYRNALAFGPGGLTRAPDGSPLSFWPLPRIFVERLKSLDFKTVKDAVKPYLVDSEIKAALGRAALILRLVGEAVGAAGEDKVLYH